MELTLIFAKKLEIRVATNADFCPGGVNGDLFREQSLEGRKQLAALRVLSSTTPPAQGRLCRIDTAR